MVSHRALRPFSSPPSPTSLEHVRSTLYHFGPRLLRSSSENFGPAHHVPNSKVSPNLNCELSASGIRYYKPVVLVVASTTKLPFGSGIRAMVTEIRADPATTYCGTLLLRTTSFEIWRTNAGSW